MLLTACNLSQVLWMQFTKSQYVAIQMPHMIQSRFYSIKLQTIIFFHCLETKWCDWSLHHLALSDGNTLAAESTMFPVFNEVLCLIHLSRLTLTPAQFSDCRSLCHPAAAHCIFSVFFNHLKAKTALAYAAPSITTEWVQLYYLDETLATPTPPDSDVLQ